MPGTSQRRAALAVALWKRNYILLGFIIFYIGHPSSIYLQNSTHSISRTESICKHARASVVRKVALGRGAQGMLRILARPQVLEQASSFSKPPLCAACLLQYQKAFAPRPWYKYNKPVIRRRTIVKLTFLCLESCSGAMCWAKIFQDVTCKNIMVRITSSRFNMNGQTWMGRQSRCQEGYGKQLINVGSIIISTILARALQWEWGGSSRLVLYCLQSVEVSFLFCSEGFQTNQALVKAEN
jgi:hypothetical protein